MATTQYIGMRYVPLFADPLEWSSELAYEPFTIVTHDGNSYTSRQFVPKGIDISNNKFWALSGNYNAQWEKYRQETIQLQASVDSLKETLYYVTPEMYGAVCDGITDDSQAIQKAIDSHFPVVLMPNKSYGIRNPLNITSNVRITGSKNSVLMVYNSDCFVIGKNVAAESVRLSDFTITSDGSGKNALHLYDNKWQSIYRNLSISKFESAIKSEVFDGCIGVVFENIYAFKNTYALNDGIGGLQGGHIIGGRYEQNEFGLLTQSPHFYVSNAIIEGNKSANVKIQGGNNSFDISFVQCYFEGSTTPVDISNKDCYGVMSFTNCTMYANPSVGFFKLSDVGKTEKNFYIISPNNDIPKLIDGNTSYDTNFVFMDIKNQVSSIPLLEKGNITYTTKDSFYSAHIIAKTITGLNNPLDYVKTKELRVSNYDYTYNVTGCLNHPWDDHVEGQPGTLCYSKNDAKLYIRVAYADQESSWKEITHA